jgi:hypothetical protein
MVVELTVMKEDHHGCCWVGSEGYFVSVVGVVRLHSQLTNILHSLGSHVPMCTWQWEHGGQ